MPVGRGLPTRKSAPPTGGGGGGGGGGKSSASSTGGSKSNGGGGGVGGPSNSRRRTRGLPLSGGGGGVSASSVTTNTTANGSELVVVVEGGRIHPSTVASSLALSSPPSSTGASATASTNTTAATSSSSSSRRRQHSLPSSSSSSTSFPQKKKKNSPTSSSISSSSFVKKESSSSSSTQRPSSTTTTTTTSSSATVIAAVPIQQAQQQAQAQAKAQQKTKLLKAVLDKNGGEQFNGRNNVNGSLKWNVKVIVNGKQYDPNNNNNNNNNKKSNNIPRKQQQQQQPKRPKRWRAYSNDDITEDADEMLRTIDSNDEDEDGITPVADIASSSSSRSIGASASASASAAAAAATTNPAIPSAGSSGPEKQPRVPSFTKRIVGNDGNFHFCKTCGETGEVVCCDGCPQVYHPQCLPVESDSFAALDDQDDDEPWYCPECVINKNNNNKQTKKKKRSNSVGGGGKKTAPSRKIKTSSSNNNSRKNKKLSLPLPSKTAREEEDEEILSPYRQQRPKRKCSYDDNGEMLVDEDGDPVAVAVAINDYVDDDDNIDDDDAEEAEIAEAMISSSSSPPKTPTLLSSSKRSYSPKSNPNTTSLTTPTDSSTNKLLSSSSSAIKKSGSGALSSMKKKSKKRQKTGSNSSGSRPISPIPSSSPKPSTPKSVQGSSKKKDKKKKKKKKNKQRSDRDDPTTVSTPGRDGGGEGSGGSDISNNDYDDNNNNDDDDDDDGGMLASLLRANSSGGVVKAVPAFYFFLNDNRNKIDRSLSRKHRYFNRLPKANMERNQLIAKEGISMWSKLTDNEVKRYVEISMKDFERRIIEWKEEKNLRNMMNNNDGSTTGIGDYSGSASGGIDGDNAQDLLLEDERLTYENHNRLYLATTVGYKPYKPDLEESNNRILLELLQDMRFHPLPLIQANRSAREYGEMDFDRITIPYFDVNGPVSTCLGDECLGCSRGWTHFCNVLKRRIPAVARRAKLQPPLSSLVATRVGLGIATRRPGDDDEDVDDDGDNIDDDDDDDDDDENSNENGINNGTTFNGEKSTGKKKIGTTTTTTSSSKTSNNKGATTNNVDVETFTSRDIPAAVEAKALLQYPWDPLTVPTERADDIVRFVEEAVCMKIREPPRPGADDKSDGNNVGISDLMSISTSAAVETTATGTTTTTSTTTTTTASAPAIKLNVPLTGRKRQVDEYGLVTEEEEEDEIIVNKCGRCRTIIDGDTGCVPCRRAQLVINLSRGEVQGEDSKLLRVQTNMLGRIVMRDGDVDSQEEGDEAVANHILRQRWTPFAILPPQTLTSPHLKITDDSSVVDDIHKHEKNEENADEEDNGGDDNDEIDGIGDEEGSSSVDCENTPDVMEIDSDISGGGSGSAIAVSDDAMVVDVDESSTGVFCDTDDVDAPGPPSKLRRVRASSRIVALESSTTTNKSTSLTDRDEDDRNILGKKFKEEANAVQRKCVSIACLSLLLALMRRDPLLLFAEPAALKFAEPAEAEGYFAVIQEPMDFGTIKKKVLQNKYATLGSFVSEARLLCDNAMLYNPPDSIYWKTAKEISVVLTVMKDRASEWTNAIKDAHASSFKYIFNTKLDVIGGEGNKSGTVSYLSGDPFHRLREDWPEAMEMLEDNEWLRKSVETDFMRTKENETAYYGSLAIRRAAMAAAVSLAPYTDSGGIFNTVGRRTYTEDEKLRNFVSEKVAETVNPPELKEIPSWREEMIMRVLRKSQARRMDGRIVSVHGCARCDGVQVDPESNKTMNAATVRWGRTRKKPNEVPRIHRSRLSLSTGLGSQKMKDRIKQHKNSDIRKGLVKGKIEALVAAANNINEVAVMARGSRIHGMGLFGTYLYRFLKLFDFIIFLVGSSNINT
jgi:hypothetical protein